MKRKFINGLLLVAMLFASMSAFVSCKDTDGDNYADMQGKLADQNQSLRDYIDGAKTALQAQLDELRAAHKADSLIIAGKISELEGKISELEEKLAAIKQCNCAEKWAAYELTITNLNNTITNLQSQIDDLKAQDALLVSRIEAIESQLPALDDRIAAIEGDYVKHSEIADFATKQALADSIAKVVTDLTSLINQAQATADAAKTAADAAQADATQALTDAAAAKAAADAAQADATQALADAAAAKAAADAAQAAANIAQTDATQALADAAAAKAAADAAQADATAAKAAADAAQAAADAAQATADAAKSLADENKSRIDDLETKVSNLADRVGVLETEMADVQQKAADALAQADLALALAKADSVRIDELTARVNANEDSIADLKARMTDAENRITTAENNIAAAQALAQQAYDLACEANNAAIEALVLAQTANDKADAALDSAAQANDKAEAALDSAALVKAKADLLETRLGDLETLVSEKVAELQSEINALNDALNDLLDKFKESLLNQISGIILQGTYNSVTGSGALPLDVRSMILAAFHGTSTQTINFPTPKAEAYVYPTKALTEKDFEMLEGVQKTQIASGQILIQNDAAEGNAGTLYLTVNPNTVDFSGVNFSLVNSQDKVSPMTLGALKASDATLSFGYTRAAQNGFYEAPVTLTKECIGKVGARLDLTKSDIKQIAEGMIQSLKNVKNGNDVDFNFLNVYNTFLRAADDIWDAQGVKAAWTNVNGDAQSVVSQYNLLATSVKPLSYNFLKGYNVKDIPTIDPISFNVDMDIDDAHWEPINWPSVTMYVWVVYVPVNGVNTVVGVYDTEAAAQAKAAEYSGATIEKMKFTVDGMADLTAKIDSWGKKVSTDNVQDLIDQIKGQVDSNVDRVINKINSKVIANLNKIINKVNKYLDNANYYIQPNMYYINDKGSFQILSTHKFIPCVFQGTEAPLFPTSLTAEIFAPAYKKFVAVTNVYKPDMTASAQSGDATCLNALKSTNSGSTMFNEVFDGTKMGVVFKPAAKGLVYEIAYTAVDYQGQVACQKFYVYTK